MIILILWWSSKDLSSYVLFIHVTFVHSTILYTHVFVTVSFNGILFRYGRLRYIPFTLPLGLDGVVVVLELCLV